MRYGLGFTVGLVSFALALSSVARADVPLQLVGHSHHRHHHRSLGHHHRHHHHGHHHLHRSRVYRSYPRSSFSFSLGAFPRTYSSFGYRSYGYGWPMYNWQSFYYSSPTLYFRSPVIAPRYYGPHCSPGGFYSPYFGLNPTTTEALLAQSRTAPPKPGESQVPDRTVVEREASSGLLGKVVTIHRDGSVTETPRRDSASRTPSVRVSNFDARQRAALYVGYGDALFRKQRYHEALQRYKTAAEAAPDLSEIYYRQGLALVGTNRFELAADVFRRGLRLNGDFKQAQLPLDELYEGNRAARIAHVDQLAQSALADERDADLFLLLGILLQADGQSERAEPFFARVQQLDASQARLLAAFSGDDSLAVTAGP